MREYPKHLFESKKFDDGTEIIRWIGYGVYSAWFAAEGEYSLFEWLKKLRDIMKTVPLLTASQVEEYTYWHGKQYRDYVIKYHHFAAWNQEREEWSIKQFGTSAERSAVGPAKHMAKECKELIDSFEKRDIESAKGEAIDMVFLAFDVCQRLGMEIDEITRRACDKLAINKNREWQKTSATEPVEHKREIHEPI